MVKEIEANLRFSIFGKNSKIQNGRHFWGGENIFVNCQIENFNYLNVAFISTMWDLMLFSGGHTTANALEKKTFLVTRSIYR